MEKMKLFQRGRRSHPLPSNVFVRISSKVSLRWTLDIGRTGIIDESDFAGMVHFMLTCKNAEHGYHGKIAIIGNGG